MTSKAFNLSNHRQTYTYKMFVSVTTSFHFTHSRVQSCHRPHEHLVCIFQKYAVVTRKHVIVFKMFLEDTVILFHLIGVVLTPPCDSIALPAMRRYWVSSERSSSFPPIRKIQSFLHDKYILKHSHLF